MRRSRRAPSPIAVVAIVVAIRLSSGCGGKAVIDRDFGAGAAGMAADTTTTTTSTGGGADPCDACMTQVSPLGEIAEAEITEASGLAPSHRHPGSYFVHNDSGGAPEFFAVDQTGADLGRYPVSKAAAVDWEDIATGRCDPSGGGDCIYLGDIGDNRAVRPSYTIYRVIEPETLAPGGHEVPADIITFSYPDGSHNAETLLSDPETGQLYIVTKVETGASSVYRFPSPLTPGTVVPTKVGEVTPPTGIAYITGGSAHASGVLLRTYTNVFLYATGTSVEERLAGAGCAVPAPAEQQGEAIAWKLDGSGYLTVSEGQGSTVYQVLCHP